jgi:hypothetical protein
VKIEPEFCPPACTVLLRDSHRLCAGLRAKPYACRCHCLRRCARYTA